MSRQEDLFALPPVANICGSCGWPKAGEPGPECDAQADHVSKQA